MSTIYPSSVGFDSFATTCGAVDTTYSADCSPIALFTPLEDFGADLTSDSASSLSPVSPGLSASPYGFPSADDWTQWDSVERSPEPDALFNSESFNGPLLSTPSMGVMTPAINPMALTMPVVNTSPYESQGLSNQVPLFQQPRVNMSMPSTQSPELSAVDVPLSAVTPAQNGCSKEYRPRNLKRKSSTSASEDDEPSPRRPSLSPLLPAQSGSGEKSSAIPSPPPRKLSHNMIEKRYRTNLNDKIMKLRDAVPTLRVVAQRREHPGAGTGEDEAGDDVSGLVEEEFNGLPPVSKLNKATILSRATAYIAQLERRNRNLETENGALRGRMEGLEMLIVGQRGAAAAALWN